MSALRRLIDRWESFYWMDHIDCEPPERIRWRTRIAWRLGSWLERWDAIVWIARGSERDFDDWQLSFAWRAFYRAKAITCLMLGIHRQRGDDVGYKSSIDAECLTWFDAQSYGTPDGPGGSCTEVQVGRGLFRNWYAFVREESWP